MNPQRTRRVNRLFIIFGVLGAMSGCTSTEPRPSPKQGWNPSYGGDIVAPADFFDKAYPERAKRMAECNSLHDEGVNSGCWKLFGYSVSRKLRKGEYLVERRNDFYSEPIAILKSRLIFKNGEIPRERFVRINRLKRDLPDAAGRNEMLYELEDSGDCELIAKRVQSCSENKSLWPVFGLSPH